MKITKTLLAFFFVLLFLKSKAQVDDRDNIVSIMPQIGIPLGDIKKTNGIILGGHLQYERKIASPTRLVFQFGGGLLQGRKYDTGFGLEDTYSSLALMQLRGGVKFFPAGGFFVAGLVGGARSVAEGESSIGFSYAPIVGYEFGNIRYFNVSVRYDASVLKDYKINTATFSIGYHLGYHFQ